MDRLVRIKSLDNFRFFKNYRWNNALKPFGKTNLIYGWNGCGKSTLSDFFFTLETNDTLPPQCAFQLCFQEDGNTESIVTKKSISTIAGRLKVYHQQYAQGLISNPDNVKHISIIGHDEGKAIAKIDAFKKEKIMWENNQINITSEEATTTKDFENYRKERATLVRSVTHYNQSYTYNKIYERYKETENPIALSQEEYDRLSIAVRATQKSRIDAPQIQFITQEICDTILEVLNTSPVFAGAVLSTVWQERNQPYDLILTPEQNISISSEDIVKISEVPSVTNTTAVLHIPVSIETGKFSATLTLTGIETAYLFGTYVEGGVFPESSVMPYLVLNNAARKQFIENGRNPTDEIPNIDWLNASFTLQTGEDTRRITSKVSGVLQDDERKNEEPTVYISLPVARELLRINGLETSCSMVYVRVSKIDQVINVSNAVKSLGFIAADINLEIQTKWDAQVKDARFYLLIVAIVYVFLLISILAKRQYSIREENAVSDMLNWIGMKQDSIYGMFVIQVLASVIIGSVVGASIAVALPSFLPQEYVETSYFALPITFTVLAISISQCVLLSLFALIKRKN